MNVIHFESKSERRHREEKEALYARLFLEADTTYSATRVVRVIEHFCCVCSWFFVAPIKCPCPACHAPASMVTITGQWTETRPPVREVP